MEKYDSENDTLAHKKRVRELMSDICGELFARSYSHDDSKLKQPEKEFFDVQTPKLKKLSYGTDEYKESLKELQIALKHHYESNSHHPEHYENGIDGMNIFDLVEMIVDWKASTERHDDGDISKSLEINKERFKMSDQIYNIFKNSINQMGWVKK